MKIEEGDDRDGGTGTEEEGLDTQQHNNVRQRHTNDRLAPDVMGCTRACMCVVLTRTASVSGSENARVPW